MRKAIMLVLLLACGAAQVCRAEGFITAEEVASWCQPYRTAVVRDAQVSVSATADSPVCFGAFLATQQFINVNLSSGTPPIFGVCAPPESTATELIKVYLRYLDEHPEQGHQRFSIVVLASLRNAYPCPSGTKPK
jgi:hypothetical protein